MIIHTTIRIPEELTRILQTARQTVSDLARLAEEFEAVLSRLASPEDQSHGNRTEKEATPCRSNETSPTSSW